MSNFSLYNTEIFYYIIMIKLDYKLNPGQNRDTNATIITRQGAFSEITQASENSTSQIKVHAQATII